MESSVEATQPKPALAPKPRLTPKPFTLQSGTTFRSIHAPKPVSKPSKPLTTHQATKLEAQAAPKAPLRSLPAKQPQQTSVDAGAKDEPPKQTKLSQDVPRKSAPPNSASTPKTTQKENVIKTKPPQQTSVDAGTKDQPPKETRLSQDVPRKSAPPNAEPTLETTQKEDVIQTNHKTEEIEKKEDGPQGPITPNLEESGSNNSSTCDPKFHLRTSRKRLPTELTSKFEAGGAPLPHQPTAAVHNTSSSKDSPKPPEPTKPKPAPVEPEPPARESEDGVTEEGYSGGDSIKRRISRLFDTKTEVTAKRDEPEIINGTGGVKERIKNWTTETNSEGVGIEKKPQVVAKPRTKSNDPPAVPSSEKTPKAPLVDHPETGTLSAEVDQPSSPAGPPPQSPVVTPRSASPQKSPETSATPSASEEPKQDKSSESEGEQSSAADGSSLKRDNVRRRSVRFGVVERDDGGPPVVLGSASESSGDEDENTEEDEPEAEAPAPLPVYRRVGTFQKRDNEIQKQRDEEDEKEKRRKEGERKQKEAELTGRVWEEERRREEEREKERLREEEREREKLHAEEMEKEKERQMELMRQRQQVEEKERARQMEQRLKQEEEEREKEKIKEEEKQTRHEGSLVHEEVHHLEEEMHQERQREEEWEKEWLRKADMQKRKEEETEREKELMWQRQKEEDRERARQMEERLREEEREKQRLAEEAAERRRKEEEEEARRRERQEEERKRRELERKMQEEEEERRRELERKMQEEEEERKRELERKMQEEEERQRRELERKMREEEEERKRRELERKMQEEEEERKRRELERKLQQEKEEEMERLKQIEMERQKEEERRRIETERQMEEERRQEDLRREMEREMELQSVNPLKESEAGPNLINFDSEEFPPSSGPAPSAESPLDVVYDDFSVKNPQLEVDFDDFSVKPKRWGSQVRPEQPPRARSPPPEEPEEEPNEVVLLRVRPLEEEATAPVEKSPRVEPTPVLQTPTEQEKQREEDGPEEEQLIFVEVQDQEEEEQDGQEEEETQEEREDRTEAQINSFGVDGEDKDTDALIDLEPKQLNGACEPTSESDSPKPVTDQVSSEDVDTPDTHVEADLAAFPESSTPLLDTSAQRSKVDLGRRRSRSRPTLRLAKAPIEIRDWRTCDSSEGKEKQVESDSEDEQPKSKILCSPPPTSQRVSVFPGMNPAALIAQLKKRTGGETGGGGDDMEGDKGREEKQSQVEAAPSPSQLSRSPRAPAHLAGAARVLPPIGGTDGSTASSPAWLKELKSKKRLSQYEGE